jgi:putative transposase
MSRAKRVTLGGYVYHVLNRANGRLRIFRRNDDFLAFEKILAEASKRFNMRVCGYCIMSNHWHLLLWPVDDGDLSNFMRWSTLTHTQRYHASHGTLGIGHLYQGRYKIFPVQNDGHYLTVKRYIEANPLRAKLVKRAEEWRWSSLGMQKSPEPLIELSDGPVELPKTWTKLVNAVVENDQIELLHNSMNRGSPFGDIDWKEVTVKKMGLESTMRSRGRPFKCTGHAL